ncbi:hypothetical protein [Gimesia aquarii]|uniref:PXPV repeat protein n=1 Tax=Gimesia aquarii TaxID=2527964 RepID=A0A517WSA6_9PLAN|nr:hypothetical protein [Gimesia aquarii]QDU08133.1 hypothetical protein V202x_14970 [Gimesia aquarii]
MRVRLMLAGVAVVASLFLMSNVSEAGERIVTRYRNPFPYVGPAPVYAVPAPVTTTMYYAPAYVPAPVVTPVYYQPAPVVVQPVTTYYAPVTPYYYSPRRVVYKTRGPGLFSPYYRSVVRYR